MSKDKYESCWKWAGSPWKSHSSWLGWIRGSLRRSWNRHPVKVAKIMADRKKIPNPNKSSVTRFPTVWGATCECCSGTFPLSSGKKEGKGVSMQVDHKNPAGTFKDVKDLQGFFERMFCVGLDDLRLVCSDCNKTLALADKQDISFQEAKAERLAIQIIKDKKDKAWLISNNIVPASAQVNRRKQIVSKLLDEGK